MKNVAPILLFTYNRIETLRETVKSLKKNYLASESDLYIFSDGFKSQTDMTKVQEVREYLSKISGFKRVIIIESEYNKGLANSIIFGVTEVFKSYDKVIVLEDDLVTSNNFLIFMNNALDYYQEKESVYSIAGYTSRIPPSNDDIYFTKRASSWGWATWKNRWDGIDWDVKDYDFFRMNRRQNKMFNSMGSDLSGMLRKQMEGKINSWAIRWVYHQYKVQKYTVYPTISKVKNIGTNENATNTVDYFGRFETPFDTSGKYDFIFRNDVGLEKKYMKYFLKQASIYTRIKFKILNFLKL